MSNFIVPQKQFEILESLHPQWPSLSQKISDSVGLTRQEIYTHMTRVKARGWVTIQMIKINGHAHPVPHYRISELGLAALQYGRLEREV